VHRLFRSLPAYAVTFQLRHLIWDRFNATRRVPALDSTYLPPTEAAISIENQSPSGHANTDDRLPGLRVDAGPTRRIGSDALLLLVEPSARYSRG
jgi:hypothetical protein